MVYFPFDFAYGVGCWCAALLWGMFTVLFVTCMWLVRRREGVKKVQVVAVIVLYVLATVSLGLEVTRTVRGFIFTPSGIERIVYFSDLAEPLNVTNEFIYIIMLCISDVMLLWRCWIVWNNNWLITVLPILMITAQAVAGFVAVGQYLRREVPGYGAIRAWASAMYAISLATNIILSSLIGGRIWWIMRQSSRFVVSARHGSYGALRLVIESGLAIGSAKIIEFTLFQVAFMDGHQNQSIYVLYESMPQIFGIIPTMILLSIQTGITPAGPGSGSSTAASSPSSSFGRGKNIRRQNEIYTRKGSDFPMVSVETAIYKDGVDEAMELGQRGGEEVVPQLLVRSAA